MIEARPNLPDCRRVGKHAERSGDFGCVVPGDCCRDLPVDADFETGGRPVDELDVFFGFDMGDGCIDILFW